MFALAKRAFPSALLFLTPKHHLLPTTVRHMTRRRDLTPSLPVLPSTLLNWPTSLFRDILSDDLRLSDGWDTDADWNSASRMKLDIKDHDTNFEILADVPGVEMGDLHVGVKDKVLTITAVRQTSKDEKYENFTRVERFSGRVSRSFTLPENVEADKIGAELLNGVLHVTVPKSPEYHKPEFKIDIKGTTEKPVEVKTE